MKFKSKKSNALKLFNKQFSKIDTLTESDVNTWAYVTKDLIRLFISENSDLLRQLGAYGIFYNDNFNESKKMAKSLVTECIEFIEINGVYNNTDSLISRVKANWDIIAFVLPITWGASWFLSAYISNNENKIEKIELNKEIKSLKDSLSIYKSLLILDIKNKNNNPNKKKPTN